MSVTNRHGERVLLNRIGRDAFWDLVADRYAEDDPRKWKYLAMLALRENGQWPLELIGKAFGHHRGHVMRCLNQVREKLRTELGQEPNLWGDDEECIEGECVSCDASETQKVPGDSGNLASAADALCEW